MADNLGKKIADIQRHEEENLTRKKAEELQLPYINLSSTPADAFAVEEIDEATSKEAQAVAIKIKDSIINLGVKDLANTKTQKLVENLKSKFKDVKIYIVSESSLKDAWSNYSLKEKGSSKPLSQNVDIPVEEVRKFEKTIQGFEDISRVLKEVAKAEVTKSLEALLGAALSLDTTDVHIEPQRGDIEIRFKVDGILYEVAKIDERLYNLLLSRIKLLSKLKLNIHDQPQEGSFSLIYENRSIEIRTSILPSQYGEDIALRILDSKFLLSLEELGLRSDLFEKLKHHLKEPQGLILITGPTGSGKTTTLYASIKYIETPDIKIITIEDPIEYHLEGITQTEVGKDKEYTFKSGLEGALRQDPDVILVSELRDKESAETALQGALAGRKIFSTLHALDAAGTAPRLIDLGIAPTTIASALLASVAQRLVRRLCGDCKQKTKLGNQNAELFGKLLKNLPPEVSVPKFKEDYAIYKANPSGCAECGSTGYKGRIAVFEIMSATKKIKEKITKNPSEEDLREFAISDGMTTLQQDAIIKILEGITSIEDTERVLGELREQ